MNLTVFVDLPRGTQSGTVETLGPSGDAAGRFAAQMNQKTKGFGQFLIAFQALALVVASGPELYAAAQALALVHGLEAMEFVEAVFADYPAITSAASALGAALNITRKVACGIHDDRAWYCF